MFFDDEFLDTASYSVDLYDYNLGLLVYLSFILSETKSCCPRILSSSKAYTFTLLMNKN